MAYLGQDVKKLGFGLMRPPMLGQEIDLAQLERMVDLFLEHGFTYFDTAYGYLEGRSEEAARRTLVERHPRESFLLATKLPAWAGARNTAEAEEMFWTSLRRTGAGYFDYYLLHNLGDERTRYFDDYNIWDFAAARKKEGLIRHLGFSFHDRADVLDGILTRHPDMDFVQLQINYADWDSPIVESRKCYEAARKHGKPVVIMEPVKGGSLAALPKALETRFRALEPAASLSSWAIRFAASLENVVTVLSGMSNLDQMRDNISFMEHFTPLSAAERAAVDRVRAELTELPHIPCTGCRYCVKGCPQEIAIPGIFRAMNNYLLYANLPGARGNYAWETRLGGTADKCVECGRCMEVCPQHIRIPDELKKARELLG